MDAQAAKPGNPILVVAAIALILTAPAFAGPELAACDVTLSTILPGDMAVLEVDCGRSNVRHISLTRDVGRPAAVTLGPFTISRANNADFKLVTPLVSGTHWYTATGCDDATGTAINAGKTAVITHCAIAGGVDGHPSCRTAEVPL